MYITKLVRAGVQYRCKHPIETLSGILPHYGIIDELSYDYHSLSNKVDEITESASVAGQQGFGYNYSGNNYGYDNAANITADARDATIQYNALSLPNQVGGNRFIYDGDGVKHYATLGSDEYYYCNGVVWKNGELEGIYFDDGRFVEDDGTASDYRKEIFYRDHLGSIRAIASDTNHNGTIIVDTSNNYEEYEVLAIYNYYPFGLEMEGPWQDMESAENNYMYNGKDIIEREGLRWHDYAQGETRFQTEKMKP